MKKSLFLLSIFMISICSCLNASSKKALMQTRNLLNQSLKLNKQLLSSFHFLLRQNSKKNGIFHKTKFQQCPLGDPEKHCTIWPCKACPWKQGQPENDAINKS